VRFIATVDDWQDINNPAYRVFCVHPGDYSAAGEIELQMDGNAEAPRWVRYIDDRHPVARNEQAIVEGLTFDNADYWVIQGVTQRGDETSTELGTDSEHNILDRMLVEGGRVVLRHGAHHNTLQNSVLRNTPLVPDSDRQCVTLSGNNSGNPVAIHGTRIVNNEIYNCTDSVGLHRPSDVSIPVDYSGTIVDHNDMYITSARYSDGNGNLNPQGDYACAENAVDIKAGGTPGNIVQVTNNRMWGFKQTDDACGGSGSWGDAVSVHEGAEYVLVQGNRIWDSSRGIIPGDDARRVSVIDNVIAQIDNPVAEQGFALQVEAPESEVYRNVIVDTWSWGRLIGAGNDYRCNVLIDAGEVKGTPGAGSTADYNYYYNAEQLALPGTHDLVSSQASAANHTDLVFQARRWTGPVQVRIPYGVATATSPHAGACDPNLGSRPGVGIHDHLW
jgi:hypothetical protein